MPDSSDLDYNPNNKTDIDDRRKKLTKRKKVSNFVLVLSAYFFSRKWHVFTE